MTFKLLLMLARLSPPNIAACTTGYSMKGTQHFTITFSAQAILMKFATAGAVSEINIEYSLRLELADTISLTLFCVVHTYSIFFKTFKKCIHVPSNTIVAD